MAAPTLALVLLVAGCGSSGATKTVTVNKTTTVTTTVTTSSSGGTSTSTAGAAAQNLVVTATVRQSLLAAGAAMHHLPVSDYTGLRNGLTYYAYVPATNTYWAGAALIASTSSQQAQVGDQDDGAYLDFMRVGNGAWKVYPAGIPGSTNYSCAVTVPAAVVALWGWTAGTCHPRSD
jgi:hypothetical protein